VTAAPSARVGTSLPHLVGHVAAEYQLGGVQDWHVLTTGYEDCDIDLRAGRTHLVVKVFTRDRGGLAARTAGLIARAQAAGVRHPRLHRDRGGSLVHCYDGHQLIVMDFDPGRSFYDLGRAPTTDELTAIITQAARIHALDAHPEFVFDPWAITNLIPMAAAVGPGLADPQLRRLVGRAIREVRRIDRLALPDALIHADLTKGNVLLGLGGEVTVLDFAVANRFPRVQELAVIAANLTHGSPDPLPVRIEDIEDIASLYSGIAPLPLTGPERDAPRAFGLAAAAMELLGALAERQAGNDSPETRYLISLGTAGLRDYLTAT
jgi:Ser/Thr protein kinase RdoA (MazF antagonist)